ncbi:MAG: TonB-dependent receptor [Povalibacter sp.]
MNHRIRDSLARVGLIGLWVGTAAAQAQTTSTPAGQEKVEEVIVTGFRGSLEAALENKRENVTFTDSISAEDVGKLPDNNLAEALQRVPGVQISRTNGEGQQISIRGLGPSFARVLLDGMPVSAAGEGSVDQQSRNREFDFDLLPSEIFSKLEVSKTPSASLVEGGLSGTINLRAPRPFDFDGFTASYQLQGAYQENSEKVDPRASFLISNTWGDKFGALLSVSMSQRTFRTDGWTSQGWTSGLVPGNPPDVGYSKGFDWNLPSVTTDPATRAPGFVNESGLTNAELANAQVPRLGRPETQTGDRDRKGFTAALQWRPTDSLSFDLDGLYSKLDAAFDRYTNNLAVRNTGAPTGTPPVPNSFGYITPQNFVLDANRTLQSGRLLNARFWSENREFEQETDFKHLGLTANWKILDSLGLEAKVSKDTSDFRWRMNTYLFLSSPGTVDITSNGGAGIPTIVPANDLTNVGFWKFDTVRVQPRTREEKNDNAALNLTWGDTDRNLKVGALYNKFYRERLTYSSSVGVTQGAALTPFGYTGPNDLRGFDITNFAQVVPVSNFGKSFNDNPGYNRWIVSDLDAFSAMMDPATLDANANLDFQNSGSFEEKNFSYYLEGNIRFDLGGHDLRINAGARHIDTKQEMLGFIRIPTTPPAAGNLFGLREDDYGRSKTEGEYSKWLPSLNMAYSVTDTLTARFGASKTITRPNPNDLQPFTGISTAGVVSTGNPDLDPYFSDNLDGGLEWYFAPGAVLGGNVFYKEITGFVVRSNVPQPFRNAGIPLDTITDPTIKALLPQGLDTILLFNQPVNREDTYYLNGVEILYQQRLDAILQGMGVTLNFTKLDSGSHTIVGLAETNYNAVAYYEPGAYALRLSYNYRDDYVECEINCGSTSPEVGYRKAAGYLDFNGSIDVPAFGHTFTISLEALNLLDEEEYSFYGYENRTNTLNRPGRQYILGIRGQF